MGKNETIEDLFDEAIQADGAGSTDEKEEETKTEEEDDKTKTEEEEETKTEEEDTKKEDETKVDEEELTADDDSDDPALILQRYKSLQGMYRSQKQKLDDIQKKTSEEEPPKVKASEEEPPKAEDDKIDTSWVTEAINENESIKDFGEDFPEIKEVLEVSLKSVMEKYTQAMGQAFQTLLQQIDQKYQPVAQSIDEISKRERDTEIKSVHSDYDKLNGSQELADWIDSQPKRLKDVYSSIMQEGSKDEIVELLNDFKLKTGIKMPQGKKIPKVTPQVKAKAPTSKAPVAMDDFEQAFQEAIKEGD